MPDKCPSSTKPNSPATKNQKYNKTEIISICNKTNKKCYEDMVKHFESKPNRSACTAHHSFHTIESQPTAKKPMRNCKSLNFENSKQFSSSSTSNSMTSTTTMDQLHQKSMETKINNNVGSGSGGSLSHEINKTENYNYENFEGCCTSSNYYFNSSNDNGIPINMTTIGEYNYFDGKHQKFYYTRNNKAATSVDESLEKSCRDDPRLSGVKILLRGDILGAINCLLPQLNLIRSVNLKHCNDIIAKAREYRKQIFEINKTKNLQLLHEHEYTIEKQEILNSLEDSISEAINSKEISIADKIPIKHFSNQSSSIIDEKRNSKPSSKSNLKSKHHNEDKKMSIMNVTATRSTITASDENQPKNNLKIQPKCKKTNLTNTKRKQQAAKKIIFTTFFKNSNLDKDKVNENVWKKSTEKLTKFIQDPENSSTNVTNSEDEVNTIDANVLVSKPSSSDDVTKPGGDTSCLGRTEDFELLNKIMRQLHDMGDDKIKSIGIEKMVNKQDYGKLTYSSVLKCSSADKKIEKKKNSGKAKNRQPPKTTPTTKNETTKEHQNFLVSPAMVTASAAAVENLIETQPEQTKIEKKSFCVQSSTSSSATSINHEQQQNGDENNNNHVPSPSPALSDDDILVQLEKRIVHDLETILNGNNNDCEDSSHFQRNGSDNLPETTSTAKNYNQLNYTRIINENQLLMNIKLHNIILPQFAYNYYRPVINNIMYDRNVLTNYPQIFQHSIVINRNVPTIAQVNETMAEVPATAAAAAAIRTTLNELNSLNALKRDCHHNSNTRKINEFSDVLIYQNTNFNDGKEIRAGGKMISVSDLESEALEQYRHSDESLNQKLEVLEKEAEEQYDDYE